MTWDDFYDRFFDWAESTRISRISNLENFGDADEVYDVAIEFEDEKVATRFLKKAVDAGVRFAPWQVVELISNVSDEFMPALVKSAYGKFSDEELEILSDYIEMEKILKLAKEKQTLVPGHTGHKRAGIFCGYCGSLAESNYCPNCGRLLRKSEEKSAPPQSSGHRGRCLIDMMGCLFAFGLLLMLFVVIIALG